jgi:hypothetical protein
VLIIPSSWGSQLGSHLHAIKRFEEILAAEEKISASQTSSSQGSTMIGSRWDTALNRAVTAMKGREKTKPSTSAGRVPDEGLSVKWSDKYGRQQKRMKALTKDEARELHQLRERVAKIPEIVDKRVADKVDSLVTEKMTAMMPRLFEAFGSWDASGRVGLPPIPSIIGSNSSTAAPNVLVTPDANTTAAPHVADTMAPVANTVAPVANTAAQELNASVGTGQRSSPSVSCTPMYVIVPLTAAELDTVKVTHFSHRVT